MQLFTTLVPTAVCNTPTGMISTAGLTNVVLNWNSVSNGIKYDIRRRVQGTTTWTYLYNISNTTRTVNNLISSTTYEWEIRTQCASSSSSWSSTLTFTTAAGCTVPTNPDEQNISTNSADLIWDAVSSSVSYRIKWRKSPGPLNVNVVSTNFLPLTGLDPSSTYRWKVRSNCDPSESNVSAFTSWQYFNTLSSIRISSGDIELIDNLNIYPNPTRGLFNISFVSDDIVTLELLVLDAYGKVIMIENKEMFVGEYTKQVDLSEYPRGIYMVQIKTNNSFITKRVVVQ
tara:strand:- start:9446 stop:10303 length:858 start_codon:yes stop_codon:yes gene_type:complete